MTQTVQSRVISSIIGAAIGAAAGALATALTDEKKKKLIKKTLAEAKKSLQQKIDEIVVLAEEDGKQQVNQISGAVKKSLPKKAGSKEKTN